MTDVDLQQAKTALNRAKAKALRDRTVESDRGVHKALVAVTRAVRSITLGRNPARRRPETR